MRNSSDTPARLLVVDDEKFILFALQDYFGVLGYTVDCASDLAGASTLLREVEYALIIADLRLGGSDNQDGLAILALAQQQRPDTRAVMLTAYGSATITTKALSRGAYVVVNKPISLPRLAEIVTQLLGRGS